MTKELLGIKPKKLNVQEALLIAVTKAFTERFLSKFGLNQTLTSGAVKIGASMAMDKMIGGQISDILGTALMVDGVEDGVYAVMKGNLDFGGGLGGSSSEMETI